MSGEQVIQVPMPKSQDEEEIKENWWSGNAKDEQGKCSLQGQKLPMWDFSDIF